ncbi:MAG: hydrogenase formation protein HypD [Candidatus Omnitrophica bacterium]|jgi:hydrogenase expression/formation protein HypD|nr:hydrogenase formation protein HypD [Candidatus Omnitrophota bacterium]
MKYIDEFRDKDIVKKLAQRIKRLKPQNINLMEVCGTHTMAIFRSGIKQILPQGVNIISGPGCPVCVTDQGDIDSMLKLAGIKNVISTSFGDMLRVPGTTSSLEKERAKGCDIRSVYSPLDSLEIARENKNKEVVFLAVGFETTSPAIASAVSDARENKLDNFSIYPCHKLIPPALEALLKAKELRLDGFICPGHVSSIIGSASYEFVASQHKIPCVISGFEPVDILESILMLLKQIREERAEVEIQYKRAVRPEGNPLARELLKDVFTTTEARWRGLGTIPESGLNLNSDFKKFNAKEKFDLTVKNPVRPGNCLCGQVLRGVKTPDQCGLFAKACTPENPYGPCMVSSEGTCAAWYKYNR